MAGPHGCTGTTRKGNPCAAHPLKGRDVCLSHADADTRASVGFVPEAGNLGGRPRLPRPTEIGRQLAERHAIHLWRPHYRALGLYLNDDGTTTPLEKGAVIVHQGEATDVEDLGAQQAAAERIFDRIFGKPKQATEVSGPDGKPLGAMFVTDPNLAEDARALLRRAASAGSDEPGGPRAGDE